ncbi:MAG: A24 family peptidase [Candidatus Hinthialibacter sp.]
MRPEIVSAIVILGFAAYIDWKEHRVPNWLTYSAWGLGVLFHVATGGMAGLGASLLGTVVGLATLIVLYALCGMGAGDVKLMAAVGAWVGASATFQAFIWIALIGGIMGLYMILRSKEKRDRLWTTIIAARNLCTLKRLDLGRTEHAPSRILLPYGVPIAIGFYAYFIFGGLI